MTPEITTVIPTYQRPGLLARAIKSVLAQDYPHFEVHVYDNASDDETADVVSRLARRDSRVKYHVHPQNIGRVQNFAHAIAHTKTRFLNILTDKDIMLPGFFEIAMSALDREPEAGFFLGGVLYSDFEGNVVAAPFERWSADGMLRPVQLVPLMLPGQWLSWSFLSWTATLFRTDILPVIGGFEIGGDYEDVDMMLRAGVWYPAIVSRQPHAVFVVVDDTAALREENDRFREPFTMPPPRLVRLESAIATAEAAGAIRPTEAERMRMQARAEFERCCFRGAIRNVAKKDTVDARLAEDGFSATFGHRKLGDVINFITSPGPAGQFSRAVLRALRTTRRSALPFLNNHRYQAYTQLVKTTRAQLVATSDGDRPWPPLQLYRSGHI